MKEKSLESIKWDAVLNFCSDKFAEGDTLDIDAVIYLIGVQELGLGPIRFKKDDKVNLMHIAICRLLVPYGFYELRSLDQDGWPHYELLRALPPLKAGEQAVLMKQAIIQYFEDENILSEEFMEIDKQNTKFVN